jgi:peptidoglycan hydrolase CwlO-like protein
VRTYKIVLKNERKKMGVKYDKITGMPSNEDTNYNKLLEMWRNEKKKRQEVEGENTIIKGIGQNSPEMKALQNKIKGLEGTLGSAQDINDSSQRDISKLQQGVEEIKADLAREKEDRQYDNLVHKQELEDLKKWNPKLDGSPK